MCSVWRLAVILFICIPQLHCILEEENEISNEKSSVEYDVLPLFLTPLIKAGKIEEAQSLAQVTKLHELKGMKSYSGYLTVNKLLQSHFFFWFFPSQIDYENAPVVLWLQGGPGRSSLRGLLMENGPFDIEPGYLVERKATWTKNHSVIYLDNPVGAGFSFSDPSIYHTSLTPITDDLYNAIIQFFKLFPNLQKNDFYIAGQSYGGKYVPSIAHLIHEKNKEASLKINLVGIAIGNGLSDPENQLQYSEFLYQLGLINLSGKKEMEAYENKMIEQTRKKQWKAAYVTYSELMLNAKTSLFRQLTGFKNVVSFVDPYHHDEKEIKVKKYVSEPRVRAAIHAGNHTFYPHSIYVQYFLSDDMLQTVAPLVEDLINNYKVMIYNGQLDIIVPYRSTVNYLKKLKFNGSENYESAQRHQWCVNKTLAGYVTHVGNLTEVLVLSAGHSVPEDQIEWATDMLYRFTRSIPYTC